jgi:hypothetical protein
MPALECISSDEYTPLGTVELAGNGIGTSAIAIQILFGPGDVQVMLSARTSPMKLVHIGAWALAGLLSAKTSFWPE